MSKPLYSCKIELSKNDINKLLKIFGSNSQYKKYIKNSNTNYELSFYDEYFLCVTDQEVKYSYKDFDKVIETDTDFYLTNDNEVIYLPKRDMDYKFIGFIRKSFDEIDNRIGEEIGIKEISKFHDSKVMKKVLMILFILSILSAFLGLITWQIVVKSLEVPDIMAIKYRWVVLFYLPIPIISTILGFIYNSRGHDCLRNIIAGFIVFFCILGFGVTSFRLENLLLEYERDISFLNNYKDVLGVELPKKGKVMFIDNTTCGDTEGQYYSCDSIIAQIEDYEKFEKSLFSNKNWIKGEEVPEEFRVFAIGGEFDKNYHSIYNETLDQYNMFPKEKGKYKLYIMSYNYESSVLNISVNDYEVK